MRKGIANKLWESTPTKLSDTLDVYCAGVDSKGNAAAKVWNQVRTNMKPAKDVLEGELYDTRRKQDT